MSVRLYSSKELDEDTQLYYYGARYYDARTSVWQSPDPILHKYLPDASHDDDDDDRDEPSKDVLAFWKQKLPGMGGVYNSANLGMYSYTHQNPLKYVDPDGNNTRLIERMLRVASRINPAVIRAADRANFWLIGKAGPPAQDKAIGWIATGIKSIFNRPQVLRDSFAGVYQRVVGGVRFDAFAKVDGKTLNLNFFSAFPAGPEKKIQVGNAVIKGAFEALKTEARNAGFEKIIVNYYRMSGANPGRQAEKIIDLTK